MKQCVGNLLTSFVKWQRTQGNEFSGQPSIEVEGWERFNGLSGNRLCFVHLSVRPNQIHQATVVQKLDIVIQWLNYHALDKYYLQILLSCLVGGD